VVESDGERAKEITNDLRNVEERKRRMKKGKRRRMKSSILDTRALPSSRAVLKSFPSRLNRLVMPSDIVVFRDSQI